MPLNFPDPPETEYALAGRTWRRNASGWVLERDVEIIGSPVLIASGFLLQQSVTLIDIPHGNTEVAYI